MLFRNYHDKNKFVTDINPDDFKTGIIKSFRFENEYHVYYFDNHGNFRKHIINDDELRKLASINYHEHGYYNSYDKTLMQLKWTDENTDKELSYKIYLQHTQHVYNYTTKSYYAIKPVFPLSQNSDINQTLLTSAIERLIVNKSTLQDMITIYNYIVETSPDGKHIASIVNTKYPIVTQRYTSKTAKNLQEIHSVNDNVKNFIYRIDRPIIERQTDNFKTNTFDFIRMRATIPSKTKMPNRKMFIKQNIKDIVTVYLHYLEKSNSYTGYNVPTSYLKLAKIMITAADELELLFELKNLNP